MRLLHLSDWHLGRTTDNVSRRPDHEQTHAEMVAIARECRPDLILHTGDLFDASAPAFDDMRLGIEMLDELAAIAPVVVLCGNHDSPKLFRVFSMLRGTDARVRFVDRARPPSAGGILTYPTRDRETLRIAPIPFIRSTSFIDGFKAPEDWSSVYADNVHYIETVLDRGLRANYDPAHDVLVFAAHLFVVGAVLSRSERMVHIDDYATQADTIPMVAYAAFGHIHKPQTLLGRDWARYAGSPIPLDFGELDEQKSVVFVEAKPGRAASVRQVPLSGGRALSRVSGTLDEIARRAEELAGTLARVTVTTEAPTTMLYERVRDALRNTVLLAVDEYCAASDAAAVEPDSGAPDEPTIGDLFREFVAEHGAADVENEQVIELFASLVAASAAGERLALPELDVSEALSV